MKHGKMIFLVLLVLSMAAIAGAQEAMVERNVADMKFGPVPGFPTCATAAVQQGDPSKGASILLGKLTAGCVIPWHWHTPNEHLMMVSGTARMEMKDGKPFTLRPGGFALMPSHHQHQFRCTTACTVYVYGDGAFDIHYLDKQGGEISPDDAMKAVKEKATKP
jgi:quercetin dioxygenase-like cupin family protein